jgi:hypothetical protein
MADGALAGLRVLDLSRVLAGPWASQLLGDLGADVIKVEKPGSGDDTRGWGPPWLADGTGRPTTDAAYFLCTNRNKRSLTVDMTRPEGQAILRELAAQADVVLENFKVGGLAAYGLDYASLAALNPGLVYCSITGFGQDGPYAARAGYDFLIQGMGGLMSVTGRAEGEEGAGPQKVGVALTDILTGLYAGNAILAALLHREKTGQGQHIDLALLDVQVACLANQAMNYLVSGQAPRRMGNGHPNIVPYQDFPTRRWRHDPRHRQRRPVRALLRDRRPCRMGRRRALRQQCVARTASRRTDPAAAPGHGDEDQPPSGSPCWRTPPCPAVRSTTWPGSSLIRRSCIAACARTCPTPPAAWRRRWPIRSAFRRRRSATARRRRCWARTQKRY